MTGNLPFSRLPALVLFLWLLLTDGITAVEHMIRSPNTALHRRAHTASAPLSQHCREPAESTLSPARGLYAAATPQYHAATSPLNICCAMVATLLAFRSREA